MSDVSLYPISDKLMQELEKVVAQYKEGAIISIEGAAKVYELVREHETALYHEYETMTKEVEKIKLSGE